MISVIGAGPAGLFSSYLLAKRGFEVNVYEQKKSIGLPVQCTGIVTSKIKEIMSIREDIIKNRIRKVEVNSEDNSASIKLREPDLVLDRQRFDLSLAGKAEGAGAEIFLQKKFIGIEDKDVIIKHLQGNKKEKIKSEYIIGADGPLSSIYNILNPGIKREYYIGMQIRARGNFDKDVFKVYLGSICPGFFAWLVPEDENIARIGLASSRNPKSLLRDFLVKLNIKKAISIQAGLIPIYNNKIRTSKNNLYLIGDAASQVKSTTGGGIIQSLLASKALAVSIAENTDYESEWKRRLGKGLWIHLRLRKFLDKFEDKDYDKLTEMLKRPGLKEVLESESRDCPSGLIMKALLSEPKILSFIGKIF